MTTIVEYTRFDTMWKHKHNSFIKQDTKACEEVRIDIYKLRAKTKAPWTMKMIPGRIYKNIDVQELNNPRTKVR